MAELGLQVQGATAPGPDGQPMAVLIFDYGYSAHKIVMSEEVADKLAEDLPAILREAAALTRRSRLGLIVPEPGPVNLPPPNGRAN
jgi:hypothetical protein